MRRINIEDQFIPFFAGALLTGILYLALSFLSRQNYIHSFFFRSWYVQATTTWLFSVAILFVIFKSYRLKKERSILKSKVSVERLSTITPQEAKELLKVIPDKYRNAMSFRRLGELLRGYLYGEEVVRLNQELSRSDVEQIEGGHLVLNSLKQLIPVLGFLGTVLGLSLGMIKFPELSESAGNIESLRFVLKDFAASLSIAFETTLLALGYTIIVVLASSLLRRKEGSFVTEIDDKARQLITKLSFVSDSAGRPEVRFEGVLKRIVDSLRLRIDQKINETMKEWLTAWQSEFSSSIKEFLKQLAIQNGDHGKEVLDILRQKGDAFLDKLDELRDGFHKPPRYEIIVQPIEGRSDEQE